MMPTPTLTPTPPTTTSDAPTPPIRLLIVDDHEGIRIGLEMLYSRAPGVEIVGMAASGHEAIVKCRALHPDVVLMDVSMPEMDGVEATRHLRECCPGSRVVVLAAMAFHHYIQGAREAGAVGYLCKDIPTQDLIGAVRRAAGSPAWFQQLR
jgi:DNA-binding NarL/FixJ family response regulator